MELSEIKTHLPTKLIRKNIDENHILFNLIQHSGQ